jgi:hypothetical protein
VARKGHGGRRTYGTSSTSRTLELSRLAKLVAEGPSVGREQDHCQAERKALKAIGKGLKKHETLSLRLRVTPKRAASKTFTLKLTR